MKNPEYYSIAEMQRLAAKLYNERILPSCVTCARFDNDIEFCTLYRQRPPAKVIVYGCSSWIQTEIPF